MRPSSDDSAILAGLPVFSYLGLILFAAEEFSGGEQNHE